MGEGNGPIVGEDGVARCPWADRVPLLRRYHDEEWGVAIHDERGLYERLVLEGFQSGLSWLTILRKRPAFRLAFADFDADEVAAFTDHDVQRLLADAGIVRHRGKIEAAVTNARAVIGLRDDVGLDRLVWSHRPDDQPAPRTTAELPGRSDESTALAQDLHRRGFRFVGPTTAHALMEAVGIVDTHLVGCHRRGSGDPSRCS